MTLDAMSIGSLRPQGLSAPPSCVWQGGFAVPYVSVWSLWAQLCWVNGMGRMDAQEVLQGVSLSSSVFNTEPSAAWMRQLHDLSDRQRTDAALDRFLRTVDGCSSNLRYCAECLSHGYHAAIYQHRGLSAVLSITVQLRRVATAA